MQLLAAGLVTPASAAAARSRSAEASPPPSKAPSPSCRQSRRRTPALVSRGFTVVTPLSILEHELGRVQQRPQDVLGRLPPRRTRLGEDLQARRLLTLGRPSTVHERVQLVHDFRGRFLAGPQ